MNLIDIYRDLSEDEINSLLECLKHHSRPDIHKGMIPFIDVEEALDATIRMSVIGVGPYEPNQAYQVYQKIRQIKNQLEYPRGRYHYEHGRTV